MAGAFLRWCKDRGKFPGDLDFGVIPERNSARAFSRPASSSSLGLPAGTPPPTRSFEADVNPLAQYVAFELRQGREDVKGQLTGAIGFQRRGAMRRP